jgi:bleomycin hydrolase
MNRHRVATVLTGAFMFLTISSGCRREAPSKAEQVAEKLGRQEAVYMDRLGDGGRSERALSLDLSGLARPSGPAEFIRLEHLPPVEQGRTGTCWSFAATSLLESELRRQGLPVVKLSEMFTVYWEYVEKARRFVRQKGDSFLGQGSEPNLALERIARYGIVRESDYNGLPAGAKRHDHSALFNELREFLQGLKERNDWDETRAVSGVRRILDRHLGPPPDRISVEGRDLTPVEYLRDALGLKPEDYVAFMSWTYAPFYSRAEFRVPDNWPHNAEYHNLPLHEFYLTLLRSLRRGFTAVLSVDFSEPGYVAEEDIAVVPSFDLPRNFIDQSSREFRFWNRTTTDDHAVHCVGYKEGAGESWFLIKDSWENAYWGRHRGYFFYRDDYLKLKCLMFLVHRDAAKEALAAFKTGPKG